MEIEAMLALASEHGPWVLLVFYLLFRDAQKDRAIRDGLNKNTAVLIELATLTRARAVKGVLEA